MYKGLKWTSLNTRESKAQVRLHSYSTYRFSLYRAGPRYKAKPHTELYSELYSELPLSTTRTLRTPRQQHEEATAAQTPQQPRRQKRPVEPSLPHCWQTRELSAVTPQLSRACATTCPAKVRRVSSHSCQARFVEQAHKKAQLQ